MANILISYSSIHKENGKYSLYVFAEGLIKSLIDCGNNVKYLPSSEFLLSPWNGRNIVTPGISTSKLLKDVKDFAPDLIIAFNNSIPQCIIEEINCPIAVWDADSFQYFNDKDYIRKNLDRYKFLCFTNAGIENVKKIGAEEQNIALVETATSLHAEKKEIKHNISFIGTHFTNHDVHQLFKHDTPKNVGKVIKELNKDFYGDNIQILKDHHAEWMLNHIDLTTLMSISSFNDRNEILNEIKELGLTIYGDKGWYNLCDKLLYLSFCYDPTSVYSLQHNQDIYNASKACISIAHNHAKNGYPWRVLDIMATNGCLVANNSPAITSFTKGYVDIPMYDNRHEALALCEKIVNDEPYRRSIVEGSQACIQDKGRWHQRFKAISDVTGVTIKDVPTNSINYSEALPQDIYFHVKDYQIIKNMIIPHFPQIDTRSVYVHVRMPTVMYKTLKKILRRG